MGIGINLEDIARKAAKPFVIAGASVYLILNLMGCNGNTTPAPNPANNPSPKPSPTETYKLEPTPTVAPTATATLLPTPTPTASLENRITPTPEATPSPTATPVRTYTPVPKENPNPTPTLESYTPTPTATPSPIVTPMPTATPAPTATPVPKSIYELALEKLDYQTAQHWKGVARDLNSEKAISELVFLPEQGRLALAGDIKAYAADGKVSDKELSDLADPDGDGKKNSEEANNKTNPMDPSNSTQKISPATFTFVRDLAKYRDSINDGRLLPQAYSGLERVIYVVERQPKIVNGLNVFGSDALALLLADNFGTDMDKYWFLVNATALQAQDFFYVANEIVVNGDYKKRMGGPLTDKKFDEREREITNFRLGKQIEWQGPWSTPLEYEEAVRDYGSEQRASNALRWRIFSFHFFKDDIVRGGKHPSYSTFDTNTWLAVASYNNENSEKVREEILARLNDPKKYAWDESLWRGRYEGWEKVAPHFAPIAKKADEYYKIIISEGKPYEKAASLITVYAAEPDGHDTGVSLFTLWSTLVGASGGVGAARIIHPEGHETGDPQYMFILSKATEQKLNGVFVYGINDLTRLLSLSEEDMKNPKYLLLDGLFGVYSNIAALRENGAKYFGAESASGRYVRIPLTK